MVKITVYPTKAALSKSAKFSLVLLTQNTELNDLRIIICLRKSEVTVERISICNVNEKLMEHGIHYVPCSCINDIIDLLQ